MRISVFPKGDLDAMVVHKTMTVFDWIEKAKVLPAEGLELYSGMFTDTSDAFVSRVGDALRSGLRNAHALCLTRLHQPGC